MPSKSRSGSCLYLMIAVPQIWYCKIGITGATPKKRARGIDRAMWGFPLPVFCCFVPFAWHVEQALHKELDPLNREFYKGDGSTEWFLFPAVIYAFAAMLLIWAVEIAAVYLTFKYFTR